MSKSLEEQISKVVGRNNPALGPPFITSEQFKKLKHPQPSTLNEVMGFAKSGQKSISELNFLAWNELSLHHLIISYNQLQIDRFSESSVYIQASSALRAFSDQMQSIYEAKTSVVTVTGMIGIGKTYAILYEVLKCRWLNKASVFYINNPALLIENWTTYVIRELIYLLAYDLQNKDVAPQVEKIFSNEPGDNIYQKVTFYFQRISGLTCVKDIQNFLFQLKKVYRESKRAFILFFDQKTSYDRLLITKPEVKIWTDSLLFFFDLTVYGMSSLKVGGTSNFKTLYLESKFDLQQTREYLKNKILEVRRSSLQIEYPEFSTGQNELTSEDYEKYGKFFAICDATDLVPLELEVLTRMLNNPPVKDEAVSFEIILQMFYSQKSERNDCIKCIDGFKL